MNKQVELLGKALKISVVLKDGKGDQTMNTYQANIKINGQIVQARIQARTLYQAEQLFKSQYGAGNLWGFITQVMG